MTNSKLDVKKYTQTLPVDSNEGRLLNKIKYIVGCV